LITFLVLGLFPVFEQAEASASFFIGFSGYHPYYPYHYGYNYRSYRNYWPNYYYNPGYSYGWPGYYGYNYRPYGEVRTEVKPQIAKIFMDGDYVGIADDYDGWWQGLPLVPGKHRLVFRAEGHTPYAVTLRVLPNQNSHIKYQMQPGEDVIPEQEMYPERERTEKPPRRNRDYDREQGWERERERYSDRDRAPSKETRIGVSLRIEPADATVYVDGAYYGTAGRNGDEIQVLLPVGIHRIEVVRPGYESYTQDLNVTPEADNRVTIQLNKK
jgi:hypothetical protein